MIPLSSANPSLEALVDNNAHVIVFNKVDLADPKYCSIIENNFKTVNKEALFTRSIQGEYNVSNIIPTCIKLVSQLRSDARKNAPLNIMVFGIPNVGKSTLINTLRGIHLGKYDRIAKTGPNPGVTRGVSGFRVSEQPPAFLIDTPGVMIPRISNNDVGLRLALTGAIKDSIVGAEVLADYLLYILNNFNSKEYAKVLKVNPHTIIDKLLQEIAIKYNFKLPGNTLDKEASARLFIKKYRLGTYGRFTLDDITTIIKPEKEKI